MAAAVLCSVEILWLPNKYSPQNKNLYPHFWTKVRPLPIEHFFTLHKNNGFNSKTFEYENYQQVI